MYAEFFQLGSVVAIKRFSDCLHTEMPKACLLQGKKGLYSFPAVLCNKCVFAQYVSLFEIYYVIAKLKIPNKIY